LSRPPAGPDDDLWHVLEEGETLPAPGPELSIRVHAGRRAGLSRHHTVLHIVNTIALGDYGAWITGAQIGEDYSRIDFKTENKGKINKRLYVRLNPAERP
jgi:misacylated tRNA(Ala) deacylase